LLLEANDATLLFLRLNLLDVSPERAGAGRCGCSSIIVVVAEGMLE